MRGRIRELEGLSPDVWVQGEIVIDTFGLPLFTRGLVSECLLAVRSAYSLLIVVYDGTVRNRTTGGTNPAKADPDWQVHTPNTEHLSRMQQDSPEHNLRT